MPDALLRTDKDITEIYNRHVDTVYRVCFLYMKNKYDTEDAVQNTFIKLMEYKGSFQSSEHEKAWLIVTATNICKNFHRHWWRKNINIENAQNTLCDNNHVEDETLKLVLAMPPKYKTVIYMYYYEGYSTVEIARMLKKKESTIRSHLHKGRKLLKLSLGDEPYA